MTPFKRLAVKQPEFSIFFLFFHSRLKHMVNSCWPCRRARPSLIGGAVQEDTWGWQLVLWSPHPWCREGDWGGEHPSKARCVLLLPSCVSRILLITCLSGLSPGPETFTYSRPKCMWYLYFLHVPDIWFYVIPNFKLIIYCWSRKPFTKGSLGFVHGLKFT